MLVAVPFFVSLCLIPATSSATHCYEELNRVSTEESREQASRDVKSGLTAADTFV